MDHDSIIPKYPRGTLVRISLPGEKPVYGLVTKVCQDGSLVVQVGTPPRHETFIRRPREVRRA